MCLENGSLGGTLAARTLENRVDEATSLKGLYAFLSQLSRSQRVRIGLQTIERAAAP